MNVIVGTLSNKMQKFLKKYYFHEATIVIDKMCNVKYFKEAINLFIPFGKILPNGLVENTLVHIEELFISTNVKKVTYGNIDNYNILEKLKSEYNYILNYEDEYMNL